MLVTSQSQQDREQQLEDEIVALRQEKARTKTLFTKARRCLLVLLQEKNVPVETIRERNYLMTARITPALCLLVKICGSS